MNPGSRPDLANQNRMGIKVDDEKGGREERSTSKKKGGVRPVPPNVRPGDSWAGKRLGDRRGKKRNKKNKVRKKEKRERQAGGHQGQVVLKPNDYERAAGPKVKGVFAAES